MHSEAPSEDIVKLNLYFLQDPQSKLLLFAGWTSSFFMWLDTNACLLKLLQLSAPVPPCSGFCSELGPLLQNSKLRNKEFLLLCQSYCCSASWSATNIARHTFIQRDFKSWKMLHRVTYTRKAGRCFRSPIGSLHWCWGNRMKRLLQI